MSEYKTTLTEQIKELVASITDEKFHAVENTDKEIWRERPGDYYSSSLHITKQGCIGLDVGGTVRVMEAWEWAEAADLYFKAKEILS